VPPLQKYRPWVHYSIRETQKCYWYDGSQQMLKASENKNVFNCRLKAAWDDVLRINLVGGSTRLVPRRRNLALRTWYAAAAERSRSIQPNVDFRVRQCTEFVLHTCSNW